MLEDTTEMIIGALLIIGLLIMFPIVWLDKYLIERRSKNV
jgi:hypothetical protein